MALVLVDHGLVPAGVAVRAGGVGAGRGAMRGDALMDALSNPVLALAVPFIAAKEGFQSYPYKDQAGVYTIGHGFTFLPDGSPVTADTPPISEAMSFARLQLLVAETAAKVDQMVHRPMTAGQHAALTSFAFNVGTAALRTSTLLRMFETGDVQGAADQFRAWIYAGGRVSNGLVKRRAEERVMFLTADSVSSARDNADCVSPAADPETQITDALNAASLAKAKGH